MFCDGCIEISYIYLGLLITISTQYISHLGIECVMHRPIQFELFGSIWDGPLIIILIKIISAMTIIKFKKSIF